MTEKLYQTMGQVVTDPVFPEVDLALRRGRHVGDDDLEWYTFLSEARDQLEIFYNGYGWTLVYSDNYYRIAPSIDSLGNAHVSLQAMTVGQACLILYLDLTTTGTSTKVSRQQILDQLIALLGEDVVSTRLTGKAGRRETRQNDLVRQKLGGALRELQILGFIDRSADEVRLRSTLIRFADPVRGSGDWKGRLQEMVKTGEIIVDPSDSAEDEEDTDV